MADLDKYNDKGDELYKRVKQEGFSTDRKGVFVVDDYEQENSARIGNINPSGFIIIGDERYFVKYPTKRSSAQSYEVFVETFISFLSKKLGIDCIDQRVLIDHKREAVGIASHDFGEHVTVEDLGIHGGASNVQTVIDQIKRRCEEFEDVEIDYDAIAEELNRRACFDYLVKQTDRHGGNIALKVNKGADGKRHLDLAPLFDNGNAFVVPSIHYYFETDDDQVYARGQQALLGGKYKYMLDFFDQNFSEENFPKLMEEFNAEYGIRELLGEETYQMQAIKIQATVRERLYYCHKREDPGKIISPEATYVMLRSHESEYASSQQNYNKYKIQLARYYSKDERADNSFESFATGRGGEYEKFPYFDEAEEIDKTMAPEEREKISAEIAKKRREFGLIILDEVGRGRTYTHSLIGEYFTQYVLMGADEKTIRDGAYESSKDLRVSTGVSDIIYNHNMFVELREWYDVQAARRDLSHDEKREVKRAQKILNRYIRHVNSITNSKLTEKQIESLNGVGLEEGIKEKL